MAKRWEPSENVQDKELVGRRIFGDPIFDGELDEAARGLVRVDHFQDKRDDGELSCDRLGKTNSEKKVLRYLQPRCELASSKLKPRRGFGGWAAFQAEKVRSNKSIPLTIEASPVVGVPEDPASYENNVYHCHICIPDISPGVHSDYIVALHLRHLFQRFGKLVAGTNSHQVNRFQSSLLSLCTLFRKLSGRS